MEELLCLGGMEKGHVVGTLYVASDGLSSFKMGNVCNYGY